MRNRTLQNLGEKHRKKSGQQEGGEGWDKVGRLKVCWGLEKEKAFPPLSGRKVLMTSPSSFSYFSFVI